MWKKIRAWLIERFLPAWAKETVYKENEQLKRENEKLRAELRELKCYIEGFEAGVRSQRRVTINNGVTGK